MKPITALFAARTLTFAVFFTAILAFAGLAHADGHAHKRKKENLKVTAPTTVGDTILQPGHYQVREISSPDGQSVEVEFVTMVFDPTALEGFWPYEEKVMARVKSTEQALSAPAKHTHLQLLPQTTSASALFIRGAAVKYRFVPSQPANEADAMASYTDAQQRVLGKRAK